MWGQLEIDHETLVPEHPLAVESAVHLSDGGPYHHDDAPALPLADGAGLH